MVESTTHRCVLAAAIFVFSAHAEQNNDLARGPIDPYKVGLQRAAFLRIAGVDSELNSEEFEADARAGRVFVRSFDRWASLLRFDADGGGTIDWLEANLYRQELRGRFLAKYDTDNNRRLNGEERVAANSDLVRGILPPPLKRDAAALQPAGNWVFDESKLENRTPQQILVDRMTGIWDEDIDFTNFDMQKEMIEAFDADGNGQLDPKETRQYIGMFQQRRLDLWDDNADGYIDALEELRQLDYTMAAGQRMGVRRMESMADFNKDGTVDGNERGIIEGALAQMDEAFAAVERHRLWKYDDDGDGLINLTEAERMKQAREDYQARWNEFVVSRFDADGSGQMDSQQELQAMQAFQIEAFSGRNVSFQTPDADLLERFDEDGDGRLVSDEMQEAMLHVMQQHKG